MDSFVVSKKYFESLSALIVGAGLKLNPKIMTLIVNYSGAVFVFLKI